MGKERPDPNILQWCGFGRRQWQLEGGDGFGWLGVDDNDEMWEEGDFNLILVVRFGSVDFVGQKLQAKAEDESDAPVDPPKVEEKLGAVPHGLSIDSDVAKRLGTTLFKVPSFLC
ncbi:hypothetical protein LWI29_011953 [Acer saccharum]|uniref:Uncharacterized protein n=1 Tax=Acer saccharum TaxID=4024 RepID=A0AA39RW79_ACESA|nr:hypothetical protein LWI29_011953 [Acer saccharum]